MPDNKIKFDMGEASRFLERDFNQCFEQMRYYDNQQWQICKFAFTDYTAAIGAAVGLYQLSLDRQMNLVTAALAILAVAAVLGIFLLALTVRNRVYYVLVTRYVNEHRQHFLEQKPLGFQNQTRMYTNPAQPPYFNWRSSQAWFLYTISFLNSVLAGLLAFVICRLTGCAQWPWGIATFFIALAIQLIASIVYLFSREGKSAAGAVLGRE